MDGYMELNPVLNGNLETGPGVGVGPGVPGEPSMLELPGVPLDGSTLLAPPGRFWFLSFSSLLHLARLFENHTCKHCCYLKYRRKYLNDI